MRDLVTHTIQPIRKQKMDSDSLSSSMYQPMDDDLAEPDHKMWVDRSDHKDAGIVHFHGAIDSYDPDGADPGFIEVSGKPAQYSTGSVIDADDHVMQQSIFDRLPLSSQSKAEFYNWLVTDYQEEQRLADGNNGPQTKKRKH
jgi:hypothetical protein